MGKAKGAPRRLENRDLARVATFAALIAIGGWTSVPVGPVPITLQTFAVMLAGIVLGPCLAPLSVVVLGSTAAGAFFCFIVVRGRAAVAALPVPMWLPLVIGGTIAAVMVLSIVSLSNSQERITTQVTKRFEISSN